MTWAAVLHGGHRTFPEHAAVPALDAGDQVTFSAGVTERQPMEPFADAIGRADKARYGAKTSGHNCIYPL